ncbi:MAG: hypothetical protein H7242_05970, partial [Microbacteriaceae bacterium]|nr:hypothetical protein [Burkholderiaceae bacterium]
WRPWEQSTGPRPDEGKATAARNGDKGGALKIDRDNLRALKRQVAHLLREQRDLLARLTEWRRIGRVTFRVTRRDKNMKIEHSCGLQR